MENLDKFGPEPRQFSLLVTFTSMSIEDLNLGSFLNLGMKLMRSVSTLKEMKQNKGST